MKKVERQKQILNSAARLFATKRFDEVLMDDIAREAKVAKGTLYSYFPDKEELYFAVVFEGISKLNEKLQASADAADDPVGQLRQTMHAILSFFKTNRFFFRLMNIEDHKTEARAGKNRKRWHDERRKQVESIEAILENGASQDVFEIHHIKVEAQLLRDMVRSILTANTGLSVDEMVELIMRVFLQGVQRQR
jgi:AcrR family transcriptional regulator